MTLGDRRVLSESRVDPVLLATLVDDPDIWVRTELGHNHNTPPEVLVRLGADPEPDVQATAAGTDPDAGPVGRRRAQRGAGAGGVEPESPTRGSGSPRRPPRPEGTGRSGRKRYDTSRAAGGLGRRPGPEGYVGRSPVTRPPPPRSWPA